jgi:hypothetical protein
MLYNNIKMNVIGIRYESVHSIQLARDRNQWRPLVHVVVIL